MRYQGSEAYSFDAAERAYERRSLREAPSFEVVLGGGFDAQARRGVSPQFVARVRTALLATALLVTLGFARVAITAQTVTLLQDNADLSTQISEAEDLASDLSIERSVLSSNARISRIATQNYGMVLPTDYVSITVGSDDATSDEASAEADGEAAQTSEDAGEQGDMD